jgi:ABC-type antimicrobial peptide transport system permease subunit
MQPKKSPHPPVWAEKLLEWLTVDHLQEEVQGDLQELFDKRLQEYGLRKARVYYVLDLLKLIHPRLWTSKPSVYPALTLLDMIQHYLLISFRTFRRFKGSFFINLVGLSTGLACSLLIYLWVQDEWQVDTFHEKNNWLFQVMTNHQEPGGIRTDESIPGPLAGTIVEEMPEVANAVAVVPFREGNTKGIVSFGDKHIKAREYYAGKDFFTVFSYPLLQGTKAEVLTDKYSVLLSDEIAGKLFGRTENIIGKSIEWNHEEFTGSYLISGIFKQPPPNSTAQFDLVFTFDVYREKRTHVTKWSNGGTRTYLVLRDGADMAAFNQKIGDFLQKKTDTNQQTLFVRPYADKYLYSEYENGVQTGGRIIYVRLFSLVALFVLAIACINFMNLSTARASLRMKEIGIKKAIGANRKALILQFLSESILMAFLALGVAMLMVVLLLPDFNRVTGKSLSLHWDASLLLTFFAISGSTGLFSGSYPALYLSRFKPVLMLKGKLNTATGELWTRKGLVVFQFVISIVLIVSVLVFYKQIEYIQSKHLGYDKDNIILIKKEGKLGDNREVFLNEVKNLPGVVNTSGLWGNMTRFPNTTSDLHWQGKNPDESVNFGELQIDYDFIETLGIELKAGRAYSKAFASDAQKIIFNEKAIEAMGLKDPVGKTVKLWGEDRQIIGVVKNFHAESLYEPLKPLFLSITPYTNNLAIELKAGTQKETLEKLTQLYGQYNPGVAFEFEFLDKGHFNELYTSENRVAVLSRYFASIAVVISCLGLFGLAAFTAERRRKEIGIRKVLGSDELGIVRLLTGEFIKLVFVSVLIALPLGYLLTSTWLSNFAFSIVLKWWYFALAGALALLIAWITVGTQAIKAARMNPVQTLREE